MGDRLRLCGTSTTSTAVAAVSRAARRGDDRRRARGSPDATRARRGPARRFGAVRRAARRGGGARRRRRRARFSSAAARALVGSDGAGLAEFLRAFELAHESGEDVLAVDAAHMLALVDDAEAGRRAGSRSPARRTIPASATGSGRCTTTSAGRASTPATTRARSRRSSSRSPRASGTTRASRRSSTPRDAVDEARRALARRRLAARLPPRPAEQRPRRDDAHAAGHGPERAAGHERAADPAEARRSRRRPRGTAPRRRPAARRPSREL